MEKTLDTTEMAVTETTESFAKLGELQLVLVGGGIGETVL